MALTRHRAKRSTVPKARTQAMMDMPLDVLFEIFCFMHPLDLLHLARTTKALREFLLDRRKASTLWNNVIGNLNAEHFPPCPDHMSPPAYTHLAFVPVCHGCFGPCETIEWQLRMRCCPNCFPKMTITQYDAFRNMYNNYHDKIYLPRAERLKLKDDCWHMSVIIEDPPNTVFSVRDWKVAKSRTRPLGVSLEEFIAEENDFWRSILSHARACQDWEFEILWEKVDQLLPVRNGRVKDIKGKLAELGWREIASPGYPDYSFLRLPQVSKLEPLTPSEWADICPQLISWAQNVKTDLTWRKCKTALMFVFLSIQEKLRSDPSLEVQPQPIDIAMLPVVRTTLERAIDSDMVYEDLETKLSRVVPPAIRKWSSAAVEELGQLVLNQLHSPPLSKLPVDWVIFCCKACPRNQRLRFDEALSHQHLYKERCREERRETGEMSGYDKLITGYSTHPRSFQNLRVDVAVSGRIDNLVKRMGQNPSRVTYNALCRSTVKVVCALCPPEAERMNFKDAFDHCLSAHLAKKETEVWSRISARE